MGSSVVVVGAQWGDEGKGKVVDRLAERADMVVRYAGGANAGHTLSVGGKQLVTHLVPSGVLHKGTKCVLGDGMVIDPHTLVEEIEQCEERGLLADGELLIGAGAHVVMPYHKRLEALREDKSLAIGTTRRGIGPAYEAKAARRGVRILDLLDESRLRSLVEQNLVELNALVAHYGGEPISDADDMIAAALTAGKRLEPHIGCAGTFVANGMAQGKNVLFEGAQGALLDVDHGTYPYVTSSPTIAGGACTGVGVGPSRIESVIGITKAYCTRVGEGPFPTEMADDEAQAWREAGGEFGATTGRPRRCGWLDIPALRLAARINGIDAFALTKLDVLTGRERIRVCVGYGDGANNELPVRSGAASTPAFREFDGWTEDITGATSLDDLPTAARAYVQEIERLVGVPFYLVSVGPNRNQTIELKTVF